MYGLSLAFAGALLYMSPASGGTNQLQTDIEGYVVTFLHSPALDVTVMVLFINGSIFIKNKDLPPAIPAEHVPASAEEALLRCVELCHSHAGRLAGFSYQPYSSWLIF